MESIPLSDPWWWPMVVDRELRRKKRQAEAFEIALWAEVERAVRARWCKARAYDPHKVEDGVAAGYEAALVAYRQHGDAKNMSWYRQKAANAAADHWLISGVPVTVSSATCKRMLQRGEELPSSLEYVELDED